MPYVSVHYTTAGGFLASRCSTSPTLHRTADTSEHWFSVWNAWKSGKFCVNTPSGVLDLNSSNEGRGFPGTHIE